MIVSIGLIVLLLTYAPILLVIIRIVMHVVDAISIVKIIKNKPVINFLRLHMYATAVLNELVVH